MSLDPLNKGYHLLGLHKYYLYKNLYFFSSSS